jgi:DNA-binding NtrC family response regulator
VSKFACENRLVLVVEGDELIHMHAVDMVRDLGFETLEAANADDAILLLETCSDVTVVFTDIQMPGSMDGLHLLAVGSVAADCIIGDVRSTGSSGYGPAARSAVRF